MNENDIIDYLVTRDTMGEDTICQKIANMVNTKNRNKHKATVWQGSNGYWYTYVPDNGIKSGRRLIKKRHREDIDDAIAFYHGNIKPSNKEPVLRYTLGQAYEAWRKRQNIFGITEQSFALYDYRYKIFFEYNGFTNTDITQINERDIEQHISDVLSNRPMKKDDFLHCVGMLKNVFKLAYMDRRINYNPCDRVDFSLFKRRLSPSNNTSENRIWTKDDCRKILSYIKESRETHPRRISDYALPVALFTGMRSGELAFLQWENIHEDYIYVCGSQKYKPLSHELYDSSTKTGKVRKIPMTNELKVLFKEIHDVEDEYGYLTEYVFSGRDGRINLMTLRQQARLRCKEAGVHVLGLQAARRTFNSMLKDSGMPTSVAASILGHTTNVNEKYYTYDTGNMEYKTDMMEKIASQITE